MTDRAASRRAFLGAGAAGASVAALNALSLDRALAESAGGGSTTSAIGTEALPSAALPPSIPGALTRTYNFADAIGLGIDVPAPIAWQAGSFNPAAGALLELPLDLDAGSTVLRIDAYAKRNAFGLVGFTVSRSSVATSSGGSGLGAINTNSGTGILTGAFTTPFVLAAGDQVYLETSQTNSSNVTFIGAIVTYYPPKPQLNLLSPPVRVYDSRPLNNPPNGIKAPLANGSTRAINCTVGNAVPTGAKAALVNLTVADTSGAGFIALFANDISWPGTSSINWDHVNEVIATTTVVAVDANARIAAYANLGCSANVIIDVIGFYA